MAYNEGLAERVRDLFDGAPDVVEKKMFGGVGEFHQSVHGPGHDDRCC